MGKLAQRLEELRKVPEEPSKYDLAQVELIENQKDFAKGQEKVILGLNSLIMDLKVNIEQINSVLSGLSTEISAIKLDVDLSEVNEGISGVGKSITEIESVDLSGLEQLIKNIKPVSLSQLTSKLDNLLISVQGIEILESKDVDLTPITALLSRSKTVEFKVISNHAGFPVKVIATEQTGDIYEI